MDFRGIFNDTRSQVVGILLIMAVLFAGCNEHGSNNKIYRVGIVCGVGFFADTADGFKEKMSMLGYKQGDNVIYDLQLIYNDPDKRTRTLQKFVNDGVDMIFSFPTETSLEAKAITNNTKIPVLFANANIEGVDLVDSVRVPGGNITGVRYPGPQLAIKRFEVMLEIAPQARRMWVPYLQGYPIVESQLTVLHSAAGSQGITIEEVPASDAVALEANFEARAAVLDDIGKDAVLMIAEPLAVNPEAFKVIGQFAAKYKIPVGGALMSVGDYDSIFGISTDNIAVGRQAAVLADKILKGVPAGTIPVVSAESFFSFNYKAAQKLGLTISEGLLRTADEIIR